MAIKKTTSRTKSVAKKVRKTPVIRVKHVVAPKKQFDYLRFGESYSSLILGIIVVIIATVLLLSFLHNRNVQNGSQQQLPQNSNAIGPTDIPTTVSPSILKEATPEPTIVTKSPKASATPMKAVTGGSTSREAEQKQNNQVRIYIVKAGDDLSRIAQKVYGDGDKWGEIAKRNNLKNPSLIFKGDKLTIPEIKTEKAVVVTPQPSVVVPAVEKIRGMKYTIKRGDSLYSIAERAYGDGDRWGEIADANHLTNPSVIHADNTLIIPRK